jgi:Fe-S-cluster containining protein
MFKDSLDKIVESYFAAITKTPFTYKGKEYVPHDLRVSPGLFRGYTCPANCGACCHRFSLDYIPSEPLPDGKLEFWKGDSVEAWQLQTFPHREVEFNGKTFLLRSNTQENSDDRHCNFVNKKGDGPQIYDKEMYLGCCQIHGEHPFTCDFELIRFSHAVEDLTRPNYVNQRLYGRGWAMTRVDGQKKAMCEMITGDESWKQDTMRRLTRLMEWANYFELDHCMLEIIGWVATGPWQEPLTIRNGDWNGRGETGSTRINQDGLQV